ncbi:MAG: hypothetical protein HY547_00765 [Elusimicrobia bacterium]|nr:hypothetical protein [Elusimicrobiota bacterium]
MKRLDDSTLEVIAEVVCGSGQGAGGGPSYEAPGPYRTKSEICLFFRRAGVEPTGQSSTRKWFVLESLQALNQQQGGNLVPASLERILLRLASPHEYRGDAGTLRAVVAHLNKCLIVEGLEIGLNGVSPLLQERTPTVAPLRQKFKPELPPDFLRLVPEPQLAQILTYRWEEAQRCVEGKAYLAGIVMMGSILEGVLLYRAEKTPQLANSAGCSPKDRSGKVRPLHEWGLSHLIDVAHEVGWLQGDVKRFSHALRESRNVVHPYVQRLNSDTPDADTCAICWQVVRAAVSDILQVESVV